jgi:hypothetical protein
LALKFRHFGKWNRSTWKVLKCGAGERWGKIVWTDRVRNEGALQGINEERNILHAIKERRLTGLETSCVGTAFWYMLLVGRISKGGRK